MPGCYSRGMLTGKPFFPSMKRATESVRKRVVQVDHFTSQGVAGYECCMSDLEDLARKLGVDGGVIDARATLKLGGGEEEDILVASTCSPPFEWSAQTCDIRRRRRG